MQRRSWTVRKMCMQTKTMVSQAALHGRELSRPQLVAQKRSQCFSYQSNPNSEIVLRLNESRWASTSRSDGCKIDPV